MSSSRRTWLASMSRAAAASALPLATLEAFAPSRAEAATNKPRLLVYYLPNGRRPEWWVPSWKDGELRFPPQAASLQPFAKHAAAVVGLDNRAAQKSPAAAHAMGTATVLTGSAIADLKGIKAGVSVDQVVAAEAFSTHPFRSLQLSAGEHGVCDVGGASCAYTQSVSYLPGGRALAPTVAPDVAFSQIFGGAVEGHGALTPEQRRSAYGAVLSQLSADTKRLSRVVSRTDQQTLQHYLSGVESIAQRIEASTERCALAGEQPDSELGYVERVRAFHQLIAAGFACRTTPVVSFMLEFGLNARSHAFAGAPLGHHRLSHYRSDSERAQLEKVETWQASIVAEQLTELQKRTTSDGRNLLDDTLVLVMPSMGEGHTHDHTAVCPILFGGGGFLKQHQRLDAQGVSLPRLHAALLRAYGVKGNFGPTGAIFGDDGDAPLKGLFQTI